MSWAPPDHVPQAQIQSYHVYLDGQLKATVRGNDRTKALLEKVDLTHVRPVSVSSLMIHANRPMCKEGVVLQSPENTTRVIFSN